MHADKPTTSVKNFWDKPRAELLELLQATPAGALMIRDDDRADRKIARDVLGRGHRIQAQNLPFTHGR